MKRRTVIKTGVILTSLCVSAWQLPRLLERVLGTLRPQGGAGALEALGALTGGHGAGGVGDVSTLGEIAGLEGLDLSALGAPGKNGETPVKDRKVLVISPDGPAVLETERAVIRPRTRVVEKERVAGAEGEKPS